MAGAAVELLVVASKRPSRRIMAEEILGISAVTVLTPFFAVATEAHLMEVGIVGFAHGVKLFAVHVASLAALMLVALAAVALVQL